MNDFLSKLLANYLLLSPMLNEQQLDVTTNEGFKKAIELIAEARKSYDSSTFKSFFDNIVGGSFHDFLDELYKNVVKTHDAANEASKPDFEKLSETDQENVLNAVSKYLEKYENASDETKNLASDILKDYTAWVINNTRK